MQRQTDCVATTLGAGLRQCVLRKCVSSGRGHAGRVEQWSALVSVFFCSAKLHVAYLVSTSCDEVVIVCRTERNGEDLAVVSLEFVDRFLRLSLVPHHELFVVPNTCEDVGIIVAPVDILWK